MHCERIDPAVSFFLVFEAVRDAIVIFACAAGKCHTFIYAGFLHSHTLSHKRTPSLVAH
jgi:hypothetical protein